MTDREHALERMLAQARAEAAEARADADQARASLHDFIYAVSHDLGSPARHVVAFGELIEQDHMSDLPEETVRYMKFMIDGGRRIQEMIAALLELARIQTHLETGAPTDLAALALSVVRSRSVLIEELGGDVTVSGHGSVTGDARLLLMLVSALVDNAITHGGTKAGRTVRIVINGSTLRVEDDGPGFAPDDLEKMLRPFGKLRAPDGNSGVGMGLTFASAIMEVHGGALEIRSSPGAGAVFEAVFPSEGP